MKHFIQCYYLEDSLQNLKNHLNNEVYLAKVIDWFIEILKFGQLNAIPESHTIYYIGLT